MYILGTKKKKTLIIRFVHAVGKWPVGNKRRADNRNTKHTCHGRSQSSGIGQAPNQDPRMAPCAGKQTKSSTGPAGLKVKSAINVIGRINKMAIITESWIALLKLQVQRPLAWGTQKAILLMIETIVTESIWKQCKATQITSRIWVSFLCPKSLGLGV